MENKKSTIIFFIQKAIEDTIMYFEPMSSEDSILNTRAELLNRIVKDRHFMEEFQACQSCHEKQV